MAPNTHHNLFPIRHLCVLTHITWKLYRSCINNWTCINDNNQQLLSTNVQVMYKQQQPTTALLWRVWVVQSCMRDQRATALGLYCRHCWIHCGHILQAHTYNTIWCVTTHDNKTPVAYDCTTHQMMTLLPTMHCFIRTKSYVTSCCSPQHLQYLHVVVSFQLQWTL